MTSNIKISVIMPVYNVEAYVGRAIESILNQSFQDFEFLIVNDGTPDNSGRICDEYAARDPRITVFHKENGGAPSARNLVIEKAKGKYMYFLDSDDWAEPGMLKDMFELAEANSAQYVVCGYYIDTYYSDSEYLRLAVAPQANAVYTAAADFRAAATPLFDNNLLYTPWNKLYLSAWILENNIRFPKTLWDDFPFNLAVIRDVSRVCVSTKCYYHFLRARAESETAKYVPVMYDKREEEHGWMTELYAHWQINTPESREFLARRYIERIVGCIENVTNKKCDKPAREKKQLIKAMIGTEQARAAVREARPRSFKMKLLLLPIRWRCVTLVYLQSKLITAVKSKNTKLFASLKASR